MAEENKKHFLYRKHFPQWKAILERKGKPTKEIFETAVFVLDTNSLLAPYNVGKDKIEQISEIYRKLITEKRLYVPEHALLEFAKNRSSRISDLFTNIDNQLSSLHPVKKFEYPILEGLESYKNMEKDREEIAEKLKSYKKELTKLKDEIINWNWNDPVTVMYQDEFNQDIFITSQLSEKELIKIYNQRIEDEIPPGNKDKLKDSNGIGDFLIWQSMLELGKKISKDIIFVSNDEKNDWLVKGNQKSISTRYELVDEYYRYTNGYNFVTINFNNFLENHGLAIKILDKFKEIESFFDNNHTKYTQKNLSEANKIITDFLNYYSPENNYIRESDFHEYVNGFKESYKNEYFGTDDWSFYFDYFYMFDEILTEIVLLNDEIIYQNHRMRRDTRTDQVKLLALCKEFINKYSSFTLF